MRARKGFTIVELLVVIGIIAILLGIVTVAASGSIRNGRAKRADAMCTALQQGIAAYYAQEGEWPQTIEQKSNNMGNENVYTFSVSETDTIFRDVVGKGLGKNGSKSMLVDATALFVCNASRLKNNGKGCTDEHEDKSSSSYCGNQGCVNGVDFATATAKNGKHRIPFAQMAFGYQGTKNGKFRRFWITYNANTDSVTVSK